jgi:hypothetical protein
MATGPIMAGLEEREITGFVPVKSNEPPLDSPLRRDEHEEVRQRMAARLATEHGQQLIDRRSSIAETPFGELKGVFGLRQFRHRGLDKVDHEWRWSCLSLNVKQLLKALCHWRRRALADLETNATQASLTAVTA